MMEQSPAKTGATKKLRKSPPLSKLQYAVAAAAIAWIFPLGFYLLLDWRPIVSAVTPLLAKEPAAWAQAIGGVIAILASAGIAIWVQRRDHANQARAPIEVALTIAGYCADAVFKMKQGSISLSELRKLQPSEVPFDLAGVQAMAKLANDLPVFELRNGDAVNEMLSLAHTMRQLNAYATSMTGHYHNMSEDIFLIHHRNLDGYFDRVNRSVKGLKNALASV